MISANLATIKSRADILPHVVNSLLPQVDIVRIYANDYTPDIDHPKVHIETGEDLTDNGKFYFLRDAEGEYYFSCDDDIKYPDNYVENTLHYLNKYSDYWITYHGRKLSGKGRNYYHGHDMYHCLRTVDGNWEIDVPGTGVSAFHTSLIKFDISKWNTRRMSDLMVGLELAERGIKALCVQHKIFWLQSLLTRQHTTIYKDENRDCKKQNEIADEIYGLL